MAVKLRMNNFYNKKPDPIVLKDLSREVNQIKLPNIPDTPLILFPPPEHSLTRNNFQIFSEDILHNLTNTKTETIEHKFEEEFLGKRHSMIGLKRRDYDERPNLVLRKKMRIGHSYEDGKGHAKPREDKHNNQKNHIQKNNIPNDEDMENNALYNDGDDDSLNINRGENFLPQENSEMGDDYNYDHTFS